MKIVRNKEAPLNQSRDIYAVRALEVIPSIITLQDRNPHSPTYGCFDRNYWHYKIIDFPSGMAQEFVLPLALAWQVNLPGNTFFSQPMIREWIEAGIRFTASSSHWDGSCDDYFPYERAGGAAAFSLLACLTSYEIVNMKDEEVLSFFHRRVDWLASHKESGRLSNHQALIVLCLELASRLLNTREWDVAIKERLDSLLSWQNSEGWFQEYEGCDPGYHTLTLSCLAWFHNLRSDSVLKEALIRGVNFAAHFVHPDGSFGGEYTSRNTYNCFPHGFEVIGKWMPEALIISDRIARGLAGGKAACYHDDHIVGHHAWNYLLTWRDFALDRPALHAVQPESAYFPNAGLLIEQKGTTRLYVALNKGGAFKLFRGDRLIASDTGFSVLTRRRHKIRNAVAHMVGQYDHNLGPDGVGVSGDLGWAKQTRMTPVKLLLLRVVMLTIGRFFPNAIRGILQRLLITGKRGAPFAFSRQLRWVGEQLHIRDELRSNNWESVESVALGTSQTSIYVVMSRTFQEGQLLMAHDLTDQIRKERSPSDTLSWERVL